MFAVKKQIPTYIPYGYVRLARGVFVKKYDLIWCPKVGKWLQPTSDQIGANPCQFVAVVRKV